MNENNIRDLLAEKDKEIANLQKQVKFWKDAWFEQREATGRNYWAGVRDTLRRIRNSIGAKHYGQ